MTHATEKQVKNLQKTLESLGWRFVEQGKNYYPIKPKPFVEVDEIAERTLRNMREFLPNLKPPQEFDLTLGQWMTPPALAMSVARWMHVQNKSVIDPCAGTGELVAAALQAGAGSVIAIERDPRLVDVLRSRFRGRDNVLIIEADFLELTGDQILGRSGEVEGFMNPPFEDNKEAKFFKKLFDLGCRYVTGITRADALFGRSRWEIEWHQSRVVRGIRLSRRPKFSAQGSGRHEIIVQTRTRGKTGEPEYWDEWSEERF